MIYRFGIGAAALIAKVFGKAQGFMVLGLAGFVLTGCMEIETVVRVNPDGSGTITERLVMSNEIVEMINEMAPEGQPAELVNEQELLDAASGYGEGVEYVSVTGIANEFGSGYEANYAFTDINNIRVGQKPGEKMPGAEGPGGEASDGGFTTFTMSPGYPSELVIHWPVNESGRAPDEPTEEPVSVEVDGVEQPAAQQEAAKQMMKMAFQNMRVAIHVDVAGQIVDSNATHLDGARVTLVDIAFAEFLDSEEAMTAMAANKDQTVADMKDMLRFIPGLKMEIEPEISVLFE